MTPIAPDKSNILIVDDTPANLRTLTAILSERGYQTRPVLSGEMALNAAEKKAPDLMLLDIRMPGMDGYEVCRRLKGDEHTRDIPVIFISALDDVRDKIKAFEAGGQDYVTKPFQPEEVLAKVKIHLSIRAMQIKLQKNNARLEQEIAVRKRAEEQLALHVKELSIAKARAEDADRIKSAFLAAMSHELRTPLNSIIGFTGILIQGLPGPLNHEQTKQMGMVQNSARHLLSLINDVLDISKIEAGQLKTVSEPFDMSESVRNAAQTITPLVEKKNLDLAVEIAPEVSRVKSDQRRVEQILNNLLSNAVKFTEEGGAIHLTTRIVTQYPVPSTERKFIKISVQDTGIGIKPEDMDTLFKPFLQVDSGIARKSEGTGLGLSICKSLLEKLGGEIRVESEWGKGSTFVFTLPLD